MRLTFTFAFMGALLSSAASAEGPALRGPINDVGRWHGLYAGLHVGGGSGSVGVPGASGAAEIEGLAGGGHVGMNWQRDSIVLGIEGDSSAGDVSASESGAGITASIGTTWLASVRGRMGLATGLGLLYATAGFAWAEMEFALAAGGLKASISDTMAGFVFGDGLEVSFSPVMSGRLEALQYDFSGQTLEIGRAKLDYGADITVVRGGLSIAMR